jgi:hypothetical protein
MGYVRYGAIRTFLLAMSLVIAACGESGSNPPALPQARFEVLPQAGGSARFEIVDVQAGGLRFTSLAGIPITTLGRFNVFVDNSFGPFGMTIRILDDDPVEVRYGLAGVINDTLVRVVDLPGVDVFVGSAAESLVNARPEVRVDACAPFPGQTACSPFDGLSLFGAALSGSIGDPEATRLLGRAAPDEPEVSSPSIFFYAKAKRDIAAIIRANDSRFLRVRLWVDGLLRDEVANTGNVVVKSDL